MSSKHHGRFYRIGKNRATDFINTTYDPQHETGSLRSAVDILDFLTETESVSQTDMLSLTGALADEKLARQFYGKALELRTVLTESFAAFEAQRPLQQATIVALNNILRADAGYDVLTQPAPAQYQLAYTRIDQDLDFAFAQLVRSAAQLLTDPRSPVRKCANPTCKRYFYDDSRTRRRRWCEMAVCGNRAKVSAFSDRKRAEAGTRNPDAAAGKHIP